MIRLAFCIDNFQIGGTELNAVRWAERLSPERFQLTVLHFQVDGPLRARFQRAATQLVRLPLRNLYGPGAIRQGIRLARFLARARCDVFHAHDLYSNIFGVHRWACRAAHRVLANSPSVAALLTRRDGIPPQKVVCIPNSLAEDAFVPVPAAERAAWRAGWGMPADAFVIGIVARLDRDKDHPTLLEALARLVTYVPRAHLVCIGDGPDRAKVTGLAQRLRLNGRVQFPGTLTAPFNLHHLFDVSVLSGP